MDQSILGYVAIAILISLIFMRINIGVAMGVVGVTGAYLVIGEAGLNFAKIMPFTISASYEYFVLPMFILMGMVAAGSGIAEGLFNAAQKWLGWIRGGLLMGTTLSMGMFGACTGSSLASATTFTRMALPELIKKKFHPGLAGGAIAASGTQASLIPPSALLVFYGILTEQSIATLLIAAVIPGVISVAIYCLAVWGTMRIFPHLGPGTENYPMKERFKSLSGVWPMPVIVIGVVGGLYFGVFTPTEAGAVGAVLSIAAAIAHVGFKKANLPDAFVATVQITSMIFFVIVAAHIFIRFAGISGMTDQLNTFIESLNLSQMGLVIFILVFYLVAGCAGEAMGIIAITIPFLIPLLVSNGINQVWFGILIVKVVEIGMITPPVGMIVFVVQGTAGKGPDGQDILKTAELFKGIIPFLIADIITLIILVLAPQLSLWLPSTMIN